MKKILIIEDEEAIAMIEQDYLELSNFETEVVARLDASRGNEWVRCLQEN